MLLFSILFLGLTNLSHAIGDGSLIGNGGNTIYCRPTVNTVFHGFYALDYLLDYRTSGPYSQVVAVTSWEQSRERIERGLQRLSPVLAKSFHDYAETILSDNLNSVSRWIPWDLTDILIDDQEITQLMPENCYRDTKTLDLHQTVVRSYGVDKVEYRYQQNILDHLRQQSPLQFSFFIVHEWLWDLTQDVRSLRRMNWILHSQDFEDISPEKWQSFFERTQFFNRHLPVCHRSAVVKKKISTAVGKDCSDVTSRDLARVHTLVLSDLPQAYVFRSGDFAGLYALRNLDLRRNPKILEKLPPFGFADLVNLETIFAEGSDFKELPPHLQEGPRGVRVKQ